MSGKRDITGQTFGKLKAIKISYTNEKGNIWECECECGNTCFVPATRLRRGLTNNCGCSQEKETYCVICGKKLEGEQRKYCGLDCQKEGNRLNNLKNGKAKREKNAEDKRNKKQALSPLDKTLRELRRYNEKHGTNLSYGQFVHLQGMKEGKNDVRRNS